MALTAAYIVPHPPLAVPEVGRGQEQIIQSTLDGYQTVAERIAAQAPDTIVIISPHTAYYGDWIYLSGGNGAQGDLVQFGAPEVQIRLTYDTVFRASLERAAQARDIPAGVVDAHGKALDHGMMVPLYYLEKAYPSSRYQAVSIGGSALPRPTLMEFGRCIASVAEALDRRCVLLVSGDLSHKLREDGPYGFDPAAPEFDRLFAHVVESGDVNGFAQLDPKLCEKAAECGLSGFVMMAGALDQVQEKEDHPFTSELISYEGPFGVGYGVAAFEAVDDPSAASGPSVDSAALQASASADEDASDANRYSEDPLVDLAYRTVSLYVREGRTPPVPVFDEALPKTAGCFVSIHLKDTDELRGCIGTIQPTCSNLAEEVIQNAVSAATRDPRFPAITAAELPSLSISVDVLFPPEPTTIDGLDVKRYGVIVTQGPRRGLLLPDLEGVDTIEQQLAIACAKAGISQFGPDVALERFEVVRHT